jgi:hypothetical protein
VDHQPTRVVLVSQSLANPHRNAISRVNTHEVMINVSFIERVSYTALKFIARSKYSVFSCY